MWRMLLAYVLLLTCSFVKGDGPKVPCYFIFGDSLFDAGNNNALITDAKANYPPYGVDFLGGFATGRFTNGLTISDVLTDLLGIQGLIPTFSTASGIEIIKGVNYASGAAGIRRETGSHLALYYYGARKTAIFGLGLPGCTPGEIQMNNGLCVEEMNEAAQLFNKKLIGLVDSLNAKLVGAKFTFIGIAAMQNASPLFLGYTADATCCELKSNLQCEPSIRPCPDRNLYAFMDGYHPTEIFNVLIATLAFNSPLNTFVHPLDISNLIISTT